MSKSPQHTCVLYSSYEHTHPHDVKLPPEFWGGGLDFKQRCAFLLPYRGNSACTCLLPLLTHSCRPWCKQGSFQRSFHQDTLTTHSVFVHVWLKTLYVKLKKKVQNKRPFPPYLNAPTRVASLLLPLSPWQQIVQRGCCWCLQTETWRLLLLLLHILTVQREPESNQSIQRHTGSFWFAKKSCQHLWISRFSDPEHNSFMYFQTGDSSDWAAVPLKTQGHTGSFYLPRMWF